MLQSTYRKMVGNTLIKDRYGVVLHAPSYRS
jgi:hypothetical protein